MRQTGMSGGTQKKKKKKTLFLPGVNGSSMHNKDGR